MKLTTEDDSEKEKPFALPIQSVVKKSRTQLAIELALKYNFVTKVTSLVITRPLPVTGRHTTTGEDGSTDFKPEIAVDLSPVLEVQEMQHHGSSRCQFHQHFMREFCADILAPKITKLRCDSRFQHAFTACSCVFKVITLV